MYQILVCDDDHDIVSALEIYLTGEGYGVTGAYSGQEAIDLFQQNQFHLVLMDIMMPGMDGIAATAELRKLSNVPIIFLTAKSEDTDKILGLNMGADDYITKPFGGYCSCSLPPAPVHAVGRADLCPPPVHRWLHRAG